MIGLAFAAGQLIEISILGALPPVSRLFDVVLWGLFGATAIWLSLTWLSQQQRYYETNLERVLADQERVNRQLALLSEVNHQLAASSTVDEIQVAALAFPRRLVPTRAAALVLEDAGTMLEARSEGADAETLRRWRAAYDLTGAAAAESQPRRLPEPPASDLPPAMIVPLHDGIALVGWIELYLTEEADPTADELALLATIASEIAEAVVGARHRVREARAIIELENAIAEERARIARDIHDGLAQSLAFLRMRVDLWQDWITDEPEHLRLELNSVKATLREQIQELRRAIFALRPVQFDALGFTGGLQRYIVEFAEQQNWEVEVDLNRAPVHLSPAVEVICFRVIQEALTNAAKHARASRVAVTIAAVDEGLQLSVRDDGSGFALAEAAESAASAQLGLRQMRERLMAVRGQLTLRSSPGDGTEVRAWLPLTTPA